MTGFLLSDNVIQFAFLSLLCQKQHGALTTAIFREEGGNKEGERGNSKWI